MNRTETYKVESYDEAIAILQRLKESGAECNITIYTFDFDKNLESHKVTTPESVCILEKVLCMMFYSCDYQLMSPENRTYR